MIRVLGIAVVFLLGVPACSPGSREEGQAYTTDGTGRIQTCKGLGIQACSYEATNIPKLIDGYDPDWAGIYAERKSGGYTMCYQDLPRGLFSERLLMFRCEPLAQRVATSPSVDSDQLKQKLLDNLGALAEAAATFEVCASDKRVSDDQSLEWTKHSIDLAQIAERLSDHFHDDKLYLSFELARFKIGDEPGFKSDILDQTRDCDNNSLQDAAQYVSEANEVAEFYLALPDNSLREEAAQQATVVRSER